MPGLPLYGRGNEGEAYAKRKNILAKVVYSSICISCAANCIVLFNNAAF